MIGGGRPVHHEDGHKTGISYWLRLAGGVLIYLQCPLFSAATAAPARAPLSGAMAIAAAFLFAACEPPIPRERDLLIATATTGGTFYPAGVAMAVLISQELGESEQILASAITSSGSAENISMLANGEVQLAILQALFGSMAWQGTDFYADRPVTGLRGLAVLWENVEQAVILERLATTGTIDDLKHLSGRGISLGPRWSGTEVSARAILTSLGIKPGEDFDVVNLGYGPSTDAMLNRRASGMFLAGGVPTGAITQVYAGLGAENLATLAFTEDHLERLRKAYPVWDRFTIPAATYPGQTEAIETIAQANILATSAVVPEEVIYHVLRTIWGNLETLHRHHAATRSMSLEKAVEGLPLPLHPGAVRFYREAGLAIPEELLP
jgi:uncharacterized protein